MSFHAGFDRLAYPGDTIMQWLKENSNLTWCGFYLAPAPSQHNTSWMNKREFLVGLGWGLAPIYVGQQIIGTPGNHVLTTEQGINDAQNTAQLAIHAGFPLSTVIFLDIEQGEPAQAGTLVYYNAWVEELINQGFTPGVYCSYQEVAKSLHDTDARPIFWIYNINTSYRQCPINPYPAPDPTLSTVDFARLWQYCQSNNQTCRVTVNGALIPDWDFDSAITDDPSDPTTYANSTNSQDSLAVNLDVPLIPQPTAVSGWAASLAMVAAYRDRASYSAEQVAGAANMDVQSDYDWTEIQNAISVWDLQTEGPISAMPEYWANLLQQFGPVWIVEVGNPNHVVIIVGVNGDGTAEGTSITLNNPWPPENGTVETKPFTDFETDFELATGPKTQIVHQ